MMSLVTSAGTRIHPKHKIPFTVNGWCIWNSTKGSFNGSNTVANSQQSAIIQSTLLLIILFQEEQAAAKAKRKIAKRHVSRRERECTAEEWLCPTNCSYLWCSLRCLTTLIMFYVFTHTGCVFTHRKTSATFSNDFSWQATFLNFLNFTCLPVHSSPVFYTHTHTRTPITRCCSLLPLTLQPSHVITP